MAERGPPAGLDVGWSVMISAPAAVGTVRTIRVPDPGALWMSRPTVDRGRPGAHVREPMMAGRQVRSGSKPTPSSLISSTEPVRRRPQLDRDLAGAGMTGRVAERLADEVEDLDAAAARQPRVGRRIEVDDARRSSPRGAAPRRCAAIPATTWLPSTASGRSP